MRSKLEKHIVFDAEELSLDDIKQKLLLIQSKINSKRGAIVSLLSELIKDPYQYCERSEYKKIFDVLVGKIEKGQIRRRLASDILDVRYKLQSLAGSLHQDREVSDNPSQGDQSGVIEGFSPSDAELDPLEHASANGISLATCERISDFIYENYDPSTGSISFLMNQLSEVFQGRNLSAHPKRKTRRLMQSLLKHEVVQGNQLLQRDFQQLLDLLKEEEVPEEKSDRDPRMKKPFQLRRKTSMEMRAESSVLKAILEDEETQNLDEEGLGYLGRYKVLRKLGQGSMGQVFLCKDPVTARQVALKVLHTIQNPKDVEDFLEEARALAKVKTPNSVTIYEFTDVDGALCIVSEYVEGLNGREFLEHPMFDSLKPSRAFSSLSVTLMLEQIMRGIRPLHRAGVIHRDIKPENLMIEKLVIDELEEKYKMKGRLTKSDLETTFKKHRHTAWIKINDLGLALQRQKEGVGNNESFYMSALTSCPGGTPVYMAPEVVAGKSISDKADVFALGLMMYQLYTGSKATDARKFAEKVDPVKHGQAFAYLARCARSNAENAISRKDPSLMVHADLEGNIEHEDQLFIEFMRKLTRRKKERRPDSRQLDALFQDLLGEMGLTDVIVGLEKSEEKRRVLTKENRNLKFANERLQAVLGVAIPTVVVLLSLLSFILYQRSLSSGPESTTEVRNR